MNNRLENEHVVINRTLIRVQTKMNGGFKVHYKN